MPVYEQHTKKFEPNWPSGKALVWSADEILVNFASAGLALKEGCGLRITLAASANQNVTDNKTPEKPKDWAPYLAHELEAWKHSESLVDCEQNLQNK